MGLTPGTTDYREHSLMSYASDGTTSSRLQGVCCLCNTSTGIDAQGHRNTPPGINKVRLELMC